MLLIVAHYKSSLKRAFHEKKTILKEKVAEKTKSITKSITRSILRAVVSRVFAEGEMKEHVPGKSPEPLFRKFDSSAGLASMVTIRDVNQNPFISLDNFADYLTLLAAFHQLQTAPGFGKRLEGYGLDYMKYAHFTVPRHRAISMKAKLQEALDPDSIVYSFPPPTYQHFTASPISSYIGGLPVGSISRSFTQSTMATLVDTPISDHSFFGNDSSSASTFLAPSGRLSYGENLLVDEPESSGSVRSHLFPAKSRSSSKDTASESADLPLPPIGVLLAWHAHLMRPDLYDSGIQSVYNNLKGVPFPLRQAATAIREGTLPLELPLCSLVEEVRLEDYYTYGSPTFDIPSLINIQTTFIEYCHQAGLLEVDLLQNNQAPGTSAITRYHGYMELMRTVENNHNLEPTLDIEVAWKCHRLDHDAYCEDTAGFASVTYFSSYCSYRRERWSTTADCGYNFRKDTQKAWGKRFKGEKFYQTT